MYPSREVSYVFLVCIAVYLETKLYSTRMQKKRMRYTKFVFLRIYKRALMYTLEHAGVS